MKKNSILGVSVFLICSVGALFVLSIVLLGNIIGLAQYGSVPDVNNPDLRNA